MTDTSDTSPWSPAEMAEQFQSASVQAIRQQQAFFRQMFDPFGLTGGDGMTDLGDVSRRVGTFKTRVQSGGRISIPDTEREVLGIEEGDAIQVMVVPIDGGPRNDE